MISPDPANGFRTTRSVSRCQSRSQCFLVSNKHRLLAMRDLAPRQAFAGVRTNSPEQSPYDSDLSCCAYGRGCTLFSDDGFDAEQHLQPWLDDENCMVDRYDVRLLLHDTAQITKSVQRRPNSSQIDSSDNEAELDYERYRDLQLELRSPQPLVLRQNIPEACMLCRSGAVLPILCQLVNIYGV